MEVGTVWLSRERAGPLPDRAGETLEALLPPCVRSKGATPRV